MNVWFITSLLLSATSLWFFIRRADPLFRMPMAVFLGCYGITTVIGATVIGLIHGGLLWKVLGDLTMDITLIHDVGSWRYWLLLYSPFFIAPFMVTLMGVHARPGPVLRPIVRALNDDVDTFTFIGVLLLLIGYCAFNLIHGGYGPNLLHVASSFGDFETLIRLRTQMMAGLNPDFYGVIYVGLPTMCVVALFQYLEKKQNAWLLLLASSILADAVFVLSTIQKGPLFAMMLGLFFGYISLQRIRLLALFLLGSFSIALLIVLQAALGGAFSLLSNVKLIFFRLADSFPYYVNVYPRLEPYQGLGYDLGLFGWGVSLKDNITIFNYMYPNIYWVQGSATAAAHVRGYSQDGFVGAVLVLLLISAAIICIGRLRFAMRGPLPFALYIASLIFLYFCTQTSLRGALLESYGLKYALAVIALLWMSRRILILATTSVRELLPIPHALGDKKT